MYTPPSFREDSLQVMQEFIQQYSFGLLVSSGPQGLSATHLPFLLDTTRGPQGTLLAHLARANDHWRHLEGAGEVLAIFQGPHAYVSPSWYTSRENVPTWNYVAVHARGPARLVDGEGLRSMLDRMSSHYEQALPNPWSTPELPEPRLQGMMKSIVGFEIEITQLIGKKKLSQNRTAEDRQGVIQGMRTQGAPDSLAIAALMERERP